MGFLKKKTESVAPTLPEVNTVPEPLPAPVEAILPAVPDESTTKETNEKPEIKVYDDDDDDEQPTTPVESLPNQTVDEEMELDANQLEAVFNMFNEKIVNLEKTMLLLNDRLTKIEATLFRASQ